MPVVLFWGLESGQLVLYPFSEVTAYLALARPPLLFCLALMSPE